MKPAIAEPATLAGQGTQALTKPCMVARTLGLPLHHRTRDPDQPAGTTAGEPMLLLGDRHRLPPCCRHHQFFASSPLSAWLSSRLSASSCFSRRFSSSSARSRLASETAIPPYLARHLEKVVGETLCRRQSSVSFAPASYSLTIPMICSSVNRLVRICPPPKRRSNRFPLSVALFQGAGSLYGHPDG